MAVDDLLAFDDIVSASSADPPVQPMTAAPQPSHAPATESKSHSGTLPFFSKLGQSRRDMFAQALCE